MKIPGLGWLKERFEAARARWRWLEFAVSVFRKGGRDGVGRLAAVVAYYGFFSLFPLLLVLVFVLGTLLKDPVWRERLLDSALKNFPVIGDKISPVKVGELEGQGLALVIGLLTALWAGTHAFDAFDQAMHVVWSGTRVRQRSMFKRRLRALIQLGVLGSALVVTTGATVVLTTVLTVNAAIAPASALLSVGLNIAFALVLYRVAEPDDNGWRAHLPGAIVAGIGLTLLQKLGQFYLTRLVDGASDTYGTFAVVIGLLSWLHLMASLLIWSAEISVVAWLRTSRADGPRRPRYQVKGRSMPARETPVNAEASKVKARRSSGSRL